MSFLRRNHKPCFTAKRIFILTGLVLMTYFDEADGILTVKYSFVCLLAVSCVNSCSFEFLPPPLKKTLHCYQLYVTPASYAGVPQLQSRPGDPTVFWWYSLVSPGTCRNITSYWPRPLYSTSFLVHCSLA